MKSKQLESPTIVLITDRTDLDDQLSEQFIKAKGYIGDNIIQSVTVIWIPFHRRVILFGRMGPRARGLQQDGVLRAVPPDELLAVAIALAHVVEVVVAPVL